MSIIVHKECLDQKNIKMDDIIEIEIAERFYPFKIEREEDEKLIRRSGRLIEDFIVLYRQRFSDKDVQDSLAMAAVKFAVESIKLQLEMAPQNINSQ